MRSESTESKEECSKKKLTENTHGKIYIRFG